MGLDIVELIMKIEKHFLITIPDHEAEQIITVNDIYLSVARHLNLETVSTNIINDEIILFLTMQD